MQKYIYLLELHSGEQPVNIGIFTSLPRAKSFLKTLPKKHEYAIYQLPTNTKLTKGRKMKDVLGEFDHWHYGTIEGFGDNGKEKFMVWPE
jgi:hypothetical protein